MQMGAAVKLEKGNWFGKIGGKWVLAGSLIEAIAMAPTWTIYYAAS